jgi:hypothetical protein
MKSEGIRQRCGIRRIEEINGIIRFHVSDKMELLEQQDT